jgi:hypothetical protein
MARVYNGPSTQESPAVSATVVTPHDTNELPVASRALYVGITGDLTVRLVGMGSGTVVFTNVPVGWHPISVSLVHTDTTADEIVAVW